MKIYTPLDATESEKKLVSAINDHENHINLISRQYGAALAKINRLEQRIKLLEDWKHNELVKQQNQY
jgi:hypothetical protein